MIHPEITFFEPVISESILLAGSKTGVIAVDRLTGEKKWEITANTPLFTPVVHEKTSYIAGEDGSLRAVNLTDGSLVWQRIFSGWIYPPAVSEDMLITGGSNGILSAVDSETGDLRWELDLQGQELVYRPIAEGRYVFVSLFDGHIIAVNAANGEIIWKYDASVVGTIPVISGDNVFLTGWNGVMTALSIHNGKLKWRSKFSNHRFYHATVGDDSIFISDDFAEVVILNKLNGSVIKRFCLKRNAIASPIQLDNNIYLPAFSRETGFKLLRLDIEAKDHQSTCSEIH